MIKSAKLLARHTQEMAAYSDDWSADDQELLWWLIERAERLEKMIEKEKSLEEGIAGGAVESRIGMRQYHVGSQLVEIQLLMTTDRDEFCLSEPIERRD